MMNRPCPRLPFIGLRLPSFRMQLPALDFTTAFGMTALSAWVLVGVLWLLGRQFWTQGVPYSMVAVASFGAAYVMLALQHVLPLRMALTVAHIFTIMGISCMVLCYQRFRQQAWGREDWLLVSIPSTLMLLVWLAVPDNFIVQIRARGLIFIGLMVWQLSVLMRMRRTVTGGGWWLVVIAQIVQMLSILPMVLQTDRPPTTDLNTENSSLSTVGPWVMCMVMFLNLQVSAYGYLRMLNDRQSEMERKAAALDGLTQLPSRRTLMGHAPSAMMQALEDGTPLGLLVLDIDHFKKINDMYGHLAGDAVIQRVAWVLRNQIRQQDFAARYGGEEFVVILPDASPSVLMLVGQRIADAIRAESVPVEGARVNVTISIGGHVQHVTEGFRWEELLATADAALYEAKNSGRDRVVLSAVCRAQLAPANTEQGSGSSRRGPEAGERRDDAARQ